VEEVLRYKYFNPDFEKRQETREAKRKIKEERDRMLERA